jgi:hypothetical protein
VEGNSKARGAKCICPDSKLDVDLDAFSWPTANRKVRVNPHQKIVALHSSEVGITWSEVPFAVIAPQSQEQVSDLRSCETQAHDIRPAVRCRQMPAAFSYQGAKLVERVDGHEPWLPPLWWSTILHLVGKIHGPLDHGGLHSFSE